MKRVRLNEDVKSGNGDGSDDEQATAKEDSVVFRSLKDLFGVPDQPFTHTILTDKLVRDFCTLIAEGLPADSCCNYLGIANSIYWQWMRKGQAYVDAITSRAEPNEKHQIYGWFVRCFKAATAHYLRIKNMELNVGGKDWFRAMEILSRRDRKTWSRDEPAGGDDQQYDPDDKFL
jgi:hypothetical protein